MSEGAGSSASGGDGGIELRNHPGVSATTVHGWGAVIFGVPFLGTGVVIGLVALGVIPVSPSSVHAPMWVIGVVGLIFGGAGALVLLHGIGGVLGAQRRRRMMLMHPDEPWLSDYRWRVEGERGRLGGSLRGRVFGLVAMAVFLAPFHWWAFAAGGPWMVKGIVILFDAALVLIAGHALYMLLRRLKYGGARMVYERIPVHPGEALRAEMNVGRGLGNHDAIVFTLRRVEERYVEGADDSTSVRCFEVWSESVSVDGVGGYGSGRTIPIELHVPQDGEGNELGARPGKWWEIEARAEAEGVDFREIFLAPVYARVSD